MTETTGTEAVDTENKESAATDNQAALDSEVEKVLDKYSESVETKPVIGAKRPVNYRPGQVTYFENRDVRSHSFDSSNLQGIVDEIKIIEDGIKNIIASRTKKIVSEERPVEKQRPVHNVGLPKLLVRLGLLKQEMETYTDIEIIKKEVPRRPDEVLVSEFRVMIDNYIKSLKGLNEGLRNTVTEVDGIVKNLTEVSDAFTDQIHSDRRAYNTQIKHSKAIETQLDEIVPIHESMSPLHDRYAQVEKMRDHMEMDLRESQGMELKYKTNIDMGVKYQSALKSYRTLINDFKERGDIHVNMVDKFADGASHMKIAVDNVSQICSGVAKVTQSMIMIVESIDDGNKVLGRYAALVGDQMSAAPKWEMEYNALKDAEEVYQKNDMYRIEQLKDNRKELEQLIDNTTE